MDWLQKQNKKFSERYNKNWRGLNNIRLY